MEHARWSVSGGVLRHGAFWCVFRGHAPPSAALGRHRGPTHKAAHCRRCETRDDVCGASADVVDCDVQARKEYSSLLFKYPTSVELLFSYSAFLDVCMNDSAEADAKLLQVSLASSPCPTL